MRSYRSIAIAVAVFAASCSPPASTTAQAPTPAPAPTTASTTAGKPEAPAPTPSAGNAASVTPASLVGRWGDNGDCTKDIIFNADGTFLSYTGGSGQWSLNGDRMTMSGAGGTFEVRVQRLDASTLIIQNPDGSIGTSQRC